jgi:GNAT superfamily N-acetyltransferase
MSSHATIRAATADDVAAIQDVARQSWAAAYEDVLDDEVVNAMLEGGYSEESLSSQISSAESGLFVATADGDVVGYGSAEPTAAGEGEVSVYVSPDHWGEGVGSALLERAIDHLATQGVERVRDSVLAQNEVGNAFYSERFEQVDQETVEIAGQNYTTNVYAGSIE